MNISVKAQVVLLVYNTLSTAEVYYVRQDFEYHEEERGRKWS
jgi:hypothetical protein